MVTSRLMTIEEFAALPDDGWRHELIRGELRRMPAGGVQHGAIGATLGGRLGNHVDHNGLGLAVIGTGFVWSGSPTPEPGR